MTSVFMEALDPAIEALVLFGSRSRGDPDASSDTDIAVFAAAGSADDLVGIKRGLCKATRDETVSFSVYSRSTAELMASQGGLFIWHLKLEGRILFDRNGWIKRLLGQVAPYSRPKAERDLQTFDAVLRDIAQSLRGTESTVPFEAATLFSVLRSLGMIVTTFVGSPCFGRLDPIFRLRDMMGRRFRVTSEEIETLRSARHSYARSWSRDRVRLTTTWCMEVTNKVAEILLFAQGCLYEPAH